MHLGSPKEGTGVEVYAVPYSGHERREEVVKMMIGEFIRMKREEKGWSQTEMSYEVRIPTNAISNWETGRATPNVRNLERLAPVLGFELPWMEEEMAQTRAKRRYLPSVSSRTFLPAS